MLLKTLLKYLLIIAIFSIVLPPWYYAISNDHYQYGMVFIAVLFAATTPPLVWTKFNRLAQVEWGYINGASRSKILANLKAGKKCESACAVTLNWSEMVEREVVRTARESVNAVVRRTKFKAELWAGGALLGFILQFMTIGIDFDGINPDNKFKRFHEARSTIDAYITDEHCKNRTYALNVCDQVVDALDKAQEALYKSPFPYTSNNSLIAVWRSLPPVLINFAEVMKDSVGPRQFSTEASEKINHAANEMREIAPKDPQLVYVIRFVLTLVLLVCAMYAIASKIAIAAFETSSERKQLRPSNAWYRLRGL